MRGKNVWLKRVHFLTEMEQYIMKEYFAKNNLVPLSWYIFIIECS